MTRCPKCGHVALRRSENQNNLSFVWYMEIAEHRGETPEQVRGYCKLHFGVPILRNDDEEFREKYDRIIRPHTYEDKLEMMQVPFDFPITRLMKKSQMMRYLDDVYQYGRMQHIELTEPEK